MHALRTATTAATRARLLLLSPRANHRSSSVTSSRRNATAPRMALTNDACCGASAAAPVKLDYTPVGKMEKLANGTECYFVGTPTKAALVMVPDIFGIQEFKQSCQVADRLAAAVPGLGVAQPDVFRGAPWRMADFPPTDKGVFMAFIGSHPYDDDNVKGDMARAFEALEARAGAAEKGGGGEGSGGEGGGGGGLKRLTLGFCWGAMMAVEANTDPSMRVSASAGCHPTFFGRERELGANLKGPVILLPTPGDPGQAVVDAATEAGLPFAAECAVQAFPGQVHGFMAARGDYADAQVREGAGEAVGAVAGFFAKVIG